MVLLDKGEGIRASEDVIELRVAAENERRELRHGAKVVPWKAGRRDIIATEIEGLQVLHIRDMTGDTRDLIVGEIEFFEAIEEEKNIADRSKEIAREGELLEDSQVGEKVGDKLETDRREIETFKSIEFRDSKDRIERCVEMLEVWKGRKNGDVLDLIVGDVEDSDRDQTRE